MTMRIRPNRGGRSAGVGVVLATAFALVVVSATAAQVPEPDEATVDPRATSVRGTSRLIGEVQPGSVVIEDGVLMRRTNILLTVEQASDPRVSGQARITLNIDAYENAGDQPLGLQIRYGSMRLVNEAGAWEGRFTGRLNEAGFAQTYWLQGEGAYEGLTYVMTAGGSGPLWVSSGLIYPGEPPRGIPPGLLEQDLPVLPPLALR